MSCHIMLQSRRPAWLQTQTQMQIPPLPMQSLHPKSGLLFAKGSGVDWLPKSTPLVAKAAKAAKARGKKLQKDPCTVRRSHRTETIPHLPAVLLHDKDGLPLWDGVGCQMQDEFGIAIARIWHRRSGTRVSLFTNGVACMIWERGTGTLEAKILVASSIMINHLDCDPGTSTHLSFFYGHTSNQFRLVHPRPSSSTLDMP